MTGATAVVTLTEVQLALPLVTSKPCKKCGETKPLTEFHTAKTTRDRRQGACKTCHAKSAAVWSEQNRQQRRAIALAYYHRNKEKAREYEQSNLAVVRKRQAEWRDANREHLRQYKREWSKAHPEVASLRKAKRRAREVGALSTLTRAEIGAVFEAFGNACAYCLRTGVKLTLDHVEALNSGGQDVADNIVPACAECNGRKADRGVLYMLNRCASASR